MEMLILIVILLGVYAIGYHHGEKDTRLDMKDKEVACPISGSKRTE